MQRKKIHSVSALYLNPFTQDPQYRLYVLHHLTSLQLLDRKGLFIFSDHLFVTIYTICLKLNVLWAEVKPGERKRAFKTFNTERQRVLDSIAFGRRALPPPAGREEINKNPPSNSVL